MSSPQHVVELTEGESVYAYVGPFETGAAAKAWIEETQPIRYQIPMGARQFVLHDPGEVARDLRDEVERD